MAFTFLLTVKSQLPIPVIRYFLFVPTTTLGCVVGALLRAKGIIMQPQNIVTKYLLAFVLSPPEIPPVLTDRVRVVKLRFSSNACCRHDSEQHFFIDAYLYPLQA